MEVALVPTLDEVNKPLEVAVVPSVVRVAEALPVVTNAIALTVLTAICEREVMDSNVLLGEVT